MNILLLTSVAFAQEEVFSLKKAVPNNTQEYYAGAMPGSVMMKVNILGAIHRPGVYNVPLNSELNSVLSYAGGPTIDAKMDEVMVRSRFGDTNKIKRVDLEKFFNDEKSNPYRLKPDDYVYIEQKQKIISNDILQTTTLVSSVLGIVVAMVIIDQRLSK
jgi:protein involved in polysaccharide export with SLBB domain